MAHKKGASSSRIGRGGADTLFALVEGVVTFGSVRGRRAVSVVAGPPSDGA